MLLDKALQKLQRPEPADTDRESLQCVADALNSAALANSPIDTLGRAIAQCHPFVIWFGLVPMLSEQARQMLEPYINGKLNLD